MSKTSKRRQNRQSEHQEVVAYVRVSTAKQAASGLGMDAQLESIRRYCELAGMVLHEVFVDDGKSGRRGVAGRPGLAAALDHATNTGRFVVAYSLSRLARSSRDAMNILGDLEKAGSGFVSATEPIDTSDACGRMMVGLLAVFAQFESDLASERTLEVMAGLRASGRKTGGATPYGYRAKRDGTLAEVASEQATIAKIEALQAGGLSLRRIVEVLDAEGLRRRDGQAFKLTQVVRILDRCKRNAA